MLMLMLVMAVMFAFCCLDFDVVGVDVADDVAVDGQSMYSRYLRHECFLVTISVRRKQR